MRSPVKIGYTVLYVIDAPACVDFWVQKIGMIEKGSKQAGPFSIVRIGFAEQDCSLELVPLELMKDNPAGLDLATPSIAFYVSDLTEVRESFVSKGVQATELADHGGLMSFAFSDNEGRWFAVLQG